MSLPFETTAEVAPLEQTVGQPRAEEALEFGLGIATGGYNLFVTGSPGSGRVSAVRDRLARWSRGRPIPPDWIYVNNFRHPGQPRAISMPAGQGREFTADVNALITGAARDIDRAFESDAYRHRRQGLTEELDDRRQELRHALDAFAAERNFALQATPFGVAVLALKDGVPMTAEQVQSLPAEEQEALQKTAREIHEQLELHAHEVHQLEKDASEKTVALDRAVALAAVAPSLAALRDKYSAQPEILDHLAAVESDIPEHLDLLRRPPRSEPSGPAELLQEVQPDEDGARYRVNLLVDNSGLTTAPVVLERNPTYYNLVGRLEYQSRLGTLVTDFSRIRAGALQRANGGVLVMEAIDVLRNPFSWDALKRALRSHEATIENLTEQLGLVPAASLRPQPIPLDLKVILIGTPALFELLQAADEDVRELFKVRVDFSPEMDWTEEHVLDYAAFISRKVADSDLRHFDRGAVARVVEHGARLRSDQRKLSAKLLEISDLVAESSYWASTRGHQLVTGDDVEEAIHKKTFRSNLIEERLREMIHQRVLVIETEGQSVGRINGLSVLALGDYQFGQPTKISARVALGQGTVQSVEREIALSGPIHSKGVLILSGYLMEQYAQKWPLSMRANITFEQSYDEVEGDSASSAELYALLSALSQMPIHQGIAVTGAIDQHGNVEAVGGVNEKVEGFFAVCSERRLTGAQGVMIPAANLRNLMLTREVVEAVERGTFHIWAVSTVDEGLRILTGQPSGALVDGEYPPGTLHRAVADRLREYSEHLHAFSVSGNGAKGPTARVQPTSTAD